MKSKVTYEWCCEYVNSDGDIVDCDFSEKLSDIYPARLWRDVRRRDYQPTFCLIRNYGNDEDGLLDRGYAYATEYYFDSGQKVPSPKFNQLLKLK